MNQEEYQESLYEQAREAYAEFDEALRGLNHAKAEFDLAMMSMHKAYDILIDNKVNELANSLPEQDNTDE